ncbi:MAG: [Fe-Fe] hydrogenase large subunit C-terminal domain-containing protein [Bacteroidales bacterium]|nr:[Fe-Fe] hydrogenase large subunit C-terminal domain-containing protein [Bacteroidales bacterium]
MEEKKYFHAVRVNTDLCKGCTKCVKICPTEALRVRESKICLGETRCIDCGKCINVCPYNAIEPISDPLSIIQPFPYKVAIVSASYAGQFSEDIDYETTLKGLYEVGFDEVIEESAVSEMMTRIKQHYIASHQNSRPILSSNCPAVVRLLQLRFPSLLPNLFHIEAPMSVLSMYYRDLIQREKKIPENDIGIFLIVPCIAQVTAVHQPEGAYKRMQDGAIAIKDIYNQIGNHLHKIKEMDIKIKTHPRGLVRALSGLEADYVGTEKIRTLAVSGIENVIDILHKVENHLLDQYDYIVLRSCTNGCVGGNFNVENAFIARSKINNLIKYSKNEDYELDSLYSCYLEGIFDVMPLEPRSMMELDKDIKQAIYKMKKIQELLKILPGFDCGACGSPSCKSLAEDIVQGNAKLEDCLILCKNKEDLE